MAKKIVPAGCLRIKFATGMGRVAYWISTDKINGYFNYSHLINTNTGLILPVPAGYTYPLIN
jgi:hypothetical protein